MTDHLMKRPYAVLLLMTLLAVVVPSRIVSGNVAGGIGENGQHTRPFYNIAHNPNELDEATSALDVGANALEPDLMRFSDAAVFGAVPLNLFAGPSGLFMYHDNVLVTTRMPVTVESYFDHVHALVKQGKNVALMVLDIKSAAAEYLGLDGAKKLRTAVATHLNYDGVNVAILYNVGSTSDSNYFMDNICLGPREGISIDGENDPAAVLNTLQAHLTTANSNAATNCGGSPVPYNIAFGNGSAGESLGFAPNVLPSIMEASWIRAGQPGIGNVAVPYAYPIAGSRALAYMNAGVDGLIPDADIQPQNFALTLVSLAAVADIVRNHRSDLYLATAADNPFQPPNEAYGLRVDTADVAGAGTDANLTFKLTGSCGSAQVTIDASYQKLFERADRNYVTIHSKNLGKLQTLELSSNGSCSAITGAKWSPGLVQISSARWGIPYSDNRTANFTGKDVCAGTSASLTLGDWGRDCDTTPPSASPVPSPAANGSGWNNSDVTVTWNWSDNVGGSGIDPAACTTSGVSSGEGAITLNATCKDLDGNTGNTSYTVHVDKTAPTVTCNAADGLWHADDASVTCTSSDGGSGLASNAAFALVTAVPAGTETAAALTNSRAVFDLAGNSRTAGPIGGNKVDKKPPTITIAQPAATTYVHSATLTLNYTVVDGGSGVATVTPAMDGSSTVAGAGLPSGRAIDLLTALPLGQHTFTVNALDKVGNASPQRAVTFTIVVTPDSVIQSVNQLLASGGIAAKSAPSLLSKLDNAMAKRSMGRCDETANIYAAFIHEVAAQAGKSITPLAAGILTADAQYLIAHCP
jgi:hypothetical protein